MALASHLEFSTSNTSIYFDEKWKAALGEKITAIKQAKIYFLNESRNAWWATWITQYYPNKSVFLSIKEAKSRAEELRKRGSVFHIEEMPCILIESESTFVLAININTKVPFGSYLLSTNKSDLRKEHYKNFRAFLRRGAPIFKALETFHYFSFHWKNYYDGKVIIEYGPKDDYIFDVECVTPLKNWGSSAVGSNYYLNWWAREANLNTEAINKIIKKSKRLAPLKEAN